MQYDNHEVIVCPRCSKRMVQHRLQEHLMEHNMKDRKKHILLNKEYRRRRRQRKGHLV